MTALLEVRGLHAGYGRAEVLTGLDLHLDKGHVVTVIGPNGAGKSTTLNALMGILPSRGQVTFDGVDLAEATLEDRVMLGLALVPEKRELFPTMPVEDNLVLGGYRAMKQRVPNWRGGLERVYGTTQQWPDLVTVPCREVGDVVTAVREGRADAGERQVDRVGRDPVARPVVAQRIDALARRFQTHHVRQDGERDVEFGGRNDRLE